VQVNVQPVRATAAKSKRAEPVSALAETGRIEFVGICKEHEASLAHCEACGFRKLEKQLEKFTGINGRRDDRADAFCWGVHDLVFADQFFAV
jgi:phage terminase large subunit-like protein